MSVVRLPVLTFLFALSSTTAATVPGDPAAQCRSVVDEGSFEAQGGRLVVTVPANLVNFPPGFLDKCDGNIAMELIVKEDGLVRIRGGMHGVSCGDHGQNLDAILDSVAWHNEVIYARVMKTRFAPPRLRGNPVCVTISRGWRPDRPADLLTEKSWAPKP
jgi:hypothetical protein